MTPALVDPAPPLPGTTSTLSSVLGITGPQAIPAWMTHGGGAARSAAAAVATDAVAVRHVGETLRGLLFDAASALGWQGTAAQAAEVHARGLHGRLAQVAVQLDVADHALTGFAAALAAQESVLGSAAAAWSRAGDPQVQVGLARGWAPSVQALDTADARTAEALESVAASLGRLQASARDVGWLTDQAVIVGEVAARAPGTTPSAGDQGVVRALTDALGRLGADAINGLASLANAAGEHLDAAVQVAAGLLLLQLGVSGEAAGVALDATGVGAAVGVPANVASASAIAAGTLLMGSGGAELGRHAATDDHVTPLGRGAPAEQPGGGPQPAEPGGIDIAEANYAQKSARWTFSEQGPFRGRTIGDVAADLRAGRLTPEEVPST